MNRIAVTGAGGFIGSAIVTALRTRGASVRAIFGPTDAWPRHSAHAVEGTVADITDRERLRSAFAGVDVVVHAAGPPSVAASFRDPVEFVRVHVLGTACVLEAMRAEGIPAIVYISSAEVYAPATFIVDEAHALAPRSPYGAAKLGAEAFVRAFGSSFDLRGYVLRPFSVYGPRMTPSSLLGTIVTQTLRGDVVALANLDPVRDYCYVRDVADAVTLACETVPRGIATLNVSTGEPTSVKELAETVGRRLQRTLDIRTDATQRRPLGTDVQRLVGDNALIRTTLQWKPRYDLAAGLGETLAAMAVS